jgi:pyruvate dehydrogenase E1 component beta subunit
VEEGWPQCGIASEIAAIIMESEAFDHLDAPMERITGGTMMITMTDLIESDRLNLIDHLLFFFRGRCPNAVCHSFRETRSSST